MQLPGPPYGPIQIITAFQMCADAINALGSGTIISSGGGGSTAWGAITGSIGSQSDLQSALAGKAASSHTHLMTEVTSLTAALGLKAPSSHTHLIAEITSLSTALAILPASGHTHAISNVTSLATALAILPASGHTHAIADVAGLQGALDGKVNVSSAVISTVAVLSGNLSDSSGAMVDATGLSFALVNGHQYHFQFLLRYSSATSDNGFGLGFTGPSGMIEAEVEINGAGVAGFSHVYRGSIGAYNTVIITGNVAAVGSIYLARVEGLVTANTPGNLQLRYRSELGSSGVVVYSGSIAYLNQLT